MFFALIKSALRRGAKPAAAEAPLKERSDEELMLLYSEGDVRAFEILLKRHERPIYNFVLRSCKRADVAEELTQEIFMRVVRNADSYQQKAKFTTWLYTIARNICIDRARRSKRAREMSLDEKIGDDDGNSFLDLVVDEKAGVAHMSYERRQFVERLQAALAELPEDQREVFLLKEVSGLKFREIAEVVDAPVPTVKSRMRYALQALRGHMEAYREHRFDEEERKEVVT